MLTPPPRDEDGVVLPHDHDGIFNEDGIIRRIPEHWVVPDGNGGRRLSSMAFKASSGPNAGMSVDLEALIIEAGIDPKAYVTTPHWVGSLKYTAKALRDEEFWIGHDPIEEDPPEPANPFHAEVWGTFSRGKQKRLAALAEWYVRLEDVAITGI